MSTDQVYSIGVALLNVVLLIACLRVGEDGGGQRAVVALRAAFAAQAASWILFLFPASPQLISLSFALPAAYYWLLVLFALRRAGRPVPGLLLLALGLGQAALNLHYGPARELDVMIHGSTAFGVVASFFVARALLLRGPHRTFSDVAFVTVFVFTTAINVARSLVLLARPEWLSGNWLVSQVLWPPIFAAQGLFAITGYMEDAQRRLRELALSDPLTGLLNRRGLRERMRSPWALAAREGRPLAVIAADLDHFKAVNDRHGHAGGDEVLVAAAGVMVRGLRGSDLVARLGGEEFVALLPETDAATALACAERIREDIRRLEVDSDAGPIRCTASFGVAAGSGGTSFEAMLERADAALYEAKAEGRNRVVLAAEDTPSRPALVASTGQGPVTLGRAPGAGPGR